MHQVETPQQRWEVIESFGRPPLTPQVFLVNRDDACQRLKAVFDGSANRVMLATRFPDQVVNFVCAYLASLDEESQKDATGRCLIISGVDAWTTICTQRLQRHILIADTGLDSSGEVGMRLIATASKAGHGIILGDLPGGIPDPTLVQLREPNEHQVQRALEGAGYTDQRARTLVSRSGGRMSSLLRLIQNLSALPEWDDNSAAAELAIAVVLGEWSEGQAADRSAVESISGKPYGEWIEEIRQISVRPGTPLILRDGKWKFVPRYEGWHTLGRQLHDEHLDRLRATAISVFRENDPQFELPPEERYMASIRGRVPTHSLRLRRGLAGALALLGGHPEALVSCTTGRAQETVILTVRAILADADWIRWASLDPVLPLLAEAAPHEFLHAVEQALNRKECPFVELFAQEDTGFPGRIYMSGLLWALETLAWETDLLSRAVMCLGELAACDPGGNWANRPINSLTTILLPWLPQTCASIPQCRSSVAALLNELPDIGWKLLLSLLPQNRSFSSGSHRPTWRGTIPDDWVAGVTRSDYWEQSSHYAELAVSAARTDTARLCELINKWDSLPPPARKQLVAHLMSDEFVSMPDDVRVGPWAALVDLVTRHRRYETADWAMTAEQVDQIANVVACLEPREPAWRCRRLFREDDYSLYESAESFEEQRRRLDERRRQAVKEIAAAGGTQAVLSFADTVQSPRHVGWAYGKEAGAGVDAEILPVLLGGVSNSRTDFAGAFIWGRFQSRGWQWVDETDMSQWSSNQIGQFLAFLPFSQEVWTRSTRLLGIDEECYWTRANVNPYGSSTGLDYASAQLARHGRFSAAIRCLHAMVLDRQALDTGDAIDILLAAILFDGRASISEHEIVEVIRAIQNDPNTDQRRLVELEWAYLPLLDLHDGAAPKSIERLLAKRPDMFCELIRLVFRSRKEDRAREELTEQAKNVASNAYQLLSGWSVPPGYREGGEYDGEALTALDAVKSECSITGHLEVAMTMVGHALTHVPADPDGLWIHHAAARVLNARDAEDMRKGFSLELYNSRGVHWVDPTGKPERELAEMYREKAEAVENAGYHRLGGEVRELADSYEREAQRLLSSDPYDD